MISPSSFGHAKVHVITTIYVKANARFFWIFFRKYDLPLMGFLNVLESLIISVSILDYN